MSLIKSTGLYGDAYLFEDVEQLKTDNTSSISRLGVLETDNTSSKSRLGILETDNTTNKSNIATLTTDNTTGDVHRYSGRIRSECVRPRGAYRS